MSEEKEVFFMQLSNQKTMSMVGSVRVLRNVRVLILCAVFVAISIILGKFVSITAGPFRFSFENLSIIMSGIMFGPFAGLAVGLCADLIGCIAYGYIICPQITLGACCIGFFSGLSSMFLLRSNKTLNIAFSVALAHIIGSMLVKSYALHSLMHTPYKALLWRIPLYLIIGTIEFIIILAIMKNKAFSSHLDRIYSKL